MKYKAIETANQEGVEVRCACEALDVSPSAYYDHVRRQNDGPTDQQGEERRLEHLIRVIFEESRGTYGRPRIHVELRRRGLRVGANRLRRKMEEMRLVAKPRRRFKQTTDSKHNEPIAPNLLNQNFTAQRPNEVWVSDITYIRTWEGWLYGCFIIDLFSRKVVGWAVADHMRADLVTAALDIAISRRQPPKGLIFHSDRGSQYASKAVRRRLKRMAAIQSMSRKGNCYDNAVSESFHDKLKQELLYRHPWPTRQAAKDAVIEYVERFYNARRIHTTINNLSPNEYEQQFAATKAA